MTQSHRKNGHSTNSTSYIIKSVPEVTLQNCSILCKFFSLLSFSFVFLLFDSCQCLFSFVGFFFSRIFLSPPLYFFSFSFIYVFFPCLLIFICILFFSFLFLLFSIPFLIVFFYFSFYFFLPLFSFFDLIDISIDSCFLLIFANR